MCSLAAEKDESLAGLQKEMRKQHSELLSLRQRGQEGEKLQQKVREQEKQLMSAAAHSAMVEDELQMVRREQQLSWGAWAASMVVVAGGVVLVGTLARSMSRSN